MRLEQSVINLRADGFALATERIGQARASDRQFTHSRFLYHNAVVGNNYNRHRLIRW